MGKRKLIRFGAWVFFFSIFFLSILAQDDPQIKRGRELEERIKDIPKQEEPVESDEAVIDDSGEKVLIKEIRVEGVTLISQRDIDAVVSRYEQTELSMGGLQEVADMITDEYRKRGYATSRAYLPPQTISEGVLVVRVVEGLLGELSVSGNRYFKTSLIKRRIGIEEGEPFDYNDLQKSLAYLNEHPDRTVRTVLVPGAVSGTTDIVLEVEDNFPFHVGFEFDNYGVRDIERHRYSFTLEHNNLLGFDDQLFFRFTGTERMAYDLKSAQYIIPLTRSLRTGFYFSHSKYKVVRGDFVDLGIRGKSKYYGWFLNQAIINEPDIDLRLNLGFDYKDIENFYLLDWLQILGLDTQDRLRVAKLGFDLDIMDKWGRTIFTYDFHTGIPNIMGGLSSKDPRASRDGAGGRFNKAVFNLFRLQPGPFGTSFLWKNQAQYTNHNLVASEEFQIGGPTSVRGYPLGEVSTDRGYYTSVEVSFPVYFLPREWQVPFSQDSIYDAFRIVGFYDWAQGYRNVPLAGQNKKETLRGCGFGFRLNLTKDFSTRIEFGYPLSRDSSDGRNVQRWIEANIKF